jgi:hypothetical protein
MSDPMGATLPFASVDVVADVELLWFLQPIPRRHPHALKQAGGGGDLDALTQTRAITPAILGARWQATQNPRFSAIPHPLRLDGDALGANPALVEVGVACTVAFVLMAAPMRTPCMLAHAYMVTNVLHRPLLSHLHLDLV